MRRSKHITVKCRTGTNSNQLTNVLMLAASIVRSAKKHVLNRIFFLESSDLSFEQFMMMDTSKVVKKKKKPKQIRKTPPVSSHFLFLLQHRYAVTVLTSLLQFTNSLGMKCFRTVTAARGIRLPHTFINLKSNRF